MKRIFITGATGNVGYEVIRFLCQSDTPGRVIAGVRDEAKARELFHDFPSLGYRIFDFEKADTFPAAFQEVDILFLLRPPHLAQVEKYFRPLLTEAQNAGIERIVFLSVQGAERSRIIPHNQIEKLIQALGFQYIFLRPSYFMQNLTTTLLDDIRRHRRIVLPAGKALFNWIDVQNIGEVAARLIESFDAYRNRAIELTGTENANFATVVDLLNAHTQPPVQFLNINPVRFYWLKRQSGMPQGLILVMIMLHFLPRWQKPPLVSDFYKKLTGKEPTTLSEFLRREKAWFEQ
ncbi:MAG TPA: NmrA family NAD(P)-binding protein [Saprospiraceae bacterium]|nr:NmrA family NAD(P)-binding protein [Saprospiraceae bacterium]HMP22551.1 NmrA family NAD(P)-binding protein [Saprospiraceae bacterium]